MKVRTYQNVDIDVEVEVEIEDVLTELASRIEEDDSERARWVMSSLDWMTRMLAAVTDEQIQRMPAEAIEVLRERLAGQAARY